MVGHLRLLARALFRTVSSRRSRGPARPGWPFGFEVAVRYLRADWEATKPLSFAELRAHNERRPGPRKHVRRVDVTDGDIGGVACRTFSPRGAPTRGTIVFFHGGSYIYGSTKSTHQELAARVAADSGFPVVGVEYRLAPEHTYPAQLEDALAVIDALVAAGNPPDTLVLAGDSAGGNLVLAAAMALRDRASPLRVAGLALLSPWSDLTMPGASFLENDPYDFGDREALVRHAEAFLGGIAPDDPRVSPVYADLSGLPPTLVEVGTAEIPRDDIVHLAKVLERAGVGVTLFEARDMPHNAAVFSDMHPEGQRAHEALVAFCRARLS